MSCQYVTDNQLVGEAMQVGPGWCVRGRSLTRQKLRSWPPQERVLDEFQILPRIWQLDSQGLGAS